VLMRSPAEQGQKVLMLGDDFWLLMPGSQRPLRITPSQKLLGDASTGDIATMSWSQDYTGTLAGEEPCEPGAEGAAAARTCIHLSLQAARKGVSYQRIELWLGQARHEPVRAELYVHSDKLAKQARFVLDDALAPTTVTAMVLQDRLGNHKETRVQYVARQPKVVPEAWLNPMFLARNPALE
jgi:Outer membrane lipoprotein-sorting protein